jgi:hypothetical protein
MEVGLFFPRGSNIEGNEPDQTGGLPIRNPTAFNSSHKNLKLIASLLT